MSFPKLHPAEINYKNTTHSTLVPYLIQNVCVPAPTVMNSIDSI